MNIANLPKATALQTQINGINRSIDELNRALANKNDHILVGYNSAVIYLPFRVIDDLIEKAIESYKADIKVLEQLIAKL